MKYLVSLAILVSAGCATTHQAFVSAKALPQTTPEKTRVEATPVSAPVGQPIDIKNLPLPKKSASHRNPARVIEEANTGAKQEPDEAGFINSNMIFDWDPSVLYQVYCAPNRVSLVSFEPGEKILEVHAGDKVRWAIGSSISGESQSHLTLKPFRPGISTNILVMTDRRVYNIESRSIEKEAGYMANVSWRYSDKESLVMKPGQGLANTENPLSDLKSETLNTNYVFVTKREPSWMPVRVFDDGQKTFIEFPKAIAAHQAPGLFVLSDSAERELVNYRVFDRFYVIDRLIERAELRVGDKRAESVGIERI